MSEEPAPPEDLTEQAKQRILSRLRLYMAVREIVRAVPDCTNVEQVGTVAVPVKLICDLQIAERGCWPEKEKP